jgi:hypothetical protein
MLSTSTLLRIATELVLVPLGGLLVWIGVSGRFWWERRSPLWLALGVALIYWGIRAVLRAGRYQTQWENRVRGGSLFLLGLLMLGIAAVPFLWVQPLLIIAGALVALRGLFCAALVARTQ